MCLFLCDFDFMSSCWRLSKIEDLVSKILIATPFVSGSTILPLFVRQHLVGSGNPIGLASALLLNIAHGPRTTDTPPFISDFQFQRSAAAAC